MAKVETLTSDGFDRFLETDKVVVVYFWASWCEPCKSFRHVFDKVSDKFPDAQFGKVDTEAQVQLREDFHIRSVPTIMVFREKVALCQESGAMDEKTLTDLIEQAIALDMSVVHQQIAKDMLE